MTRLFAGLTGPLLTILFLFISHAESVEKEIPKKLFVAPPPFSPGIFPCSQCHQGMPVNKKQRKLEQYHQEITVQHMPGGWCYECHNPDDRDKLRMANGTLVDFEESYKICGQCHGIILRDWKAGIHGLRTGMWNGQKQYRLCVHCHWPHEPKFKQIKPLPPPVRPTAIK